MSVVWTTKRPTAAGLYYWQDAALRAYDERAVRVVQVRKYRNREGFAAHTLMPPGDLSPPVFNCELGKEPSGRWAGPLPSPFGEAIVDEEFEKWRSRFGGASR